MDRRENIHRHALMAAGNFKLLFGGPQVPPLPAAVTRLIEEVNRPDPEVARIVRVISGSPELATRVLRTVNSVRFGLRHQIKTLKHAVVLLGLRQIRSIALSYMIADALPQPRARLYRREIFWSDSLLRALFARGFSRALGMRPEESEEAFATMLVSDVALPVLLVTWEPYYQPLIEQWRRADQRLSQIERAQFNWDHAQAGAWMLKSWGFPEETVCCVGAHCLSPAEIRERDLGTTIALPMSIASLVASELKPQPDRLKRLIETASREMQIGTEEFLAIAGEVRQHLQETRRLFGLRALPRTKVLDELQGGGDEERPAA
jgi:HD-like signal output (HDOD) protein